MNDGTYVDLIRPDLVPHLNNVIEVATRDLPDGGTMAFLYTSKGVFRASADTEQKALNDALEKVAQAFPPDSPVE